MITGFKIYENKNYTSIGDIIVMSDDYYEIIQDMDDNYVWTYENGGNLAKHNAGIFNWWVKKDNVKIFSVDKFIKEYPKYKEEILDIYLLTDEDNNFIHDVWSKNKNFLVYVEAEKYNL